MEETSPAEVNVKEAVFVHTMKFGRTVAPGAAGVSYNTDLPLNMYRKPHNQMSELGIKAPFKGLPNHILIFCLNALLPNKGIVLNCSFSTKVAW